MLKLIFSRYLLYGVLGVEALLLPYFLSKEMYGEIEYYKFTAFLAQFLLFGSATGYVVRYLKARSKYRSTITCSFLTIGILYSCFSGIAIYLSQSVTLSVICTATMIALIFESLEKVRERYLLAMSYKPILSSCFILFIPLLIIYEVTLQNFVVIVFISSLFIYFAIIIMHSRNEINLLEFKVSRNCFCRDYISNVRNGFMMNVSTAMMFIFFYIDRTIVREKYPLLLADYSLSYAIMQLTIVAITMFSYVNIVEFGKSKPSTAQLKERAVLALKNCFLFFIVIGLCSIAFSYLVEEFYKYNDVFETTCLMVVMFGIASVLNSVNSVYLYLGKIKNLAFYMLSALIISIISNFIFEHIGFSGYYIMLFKTYIIYLLFSLLSCFYIFSKFSK